MSTRAERHIGFRRNRSHPDLGLCSDHRFDPDSVGHAVMCVVGMVVRQRIAPGEKPGKWISPGARA